MSDLSQRALKAREAIDAWETREHARLLQTAYRLQRVKTPLTSITGESASKAVDEAEAFVAEALEGL